jgi:hypothetical protein
MKTQHVFGAGAATVLVMTMAAFAQTPQSSQPATPGSRSSAEAQAASQDRASRQPEAPVTLVGCVMREADYRKATNEGKGGPVGTGLGRSDEFVLVHATKTTAGAASGAKVDCSSATATSGEAYELSGSGEKDAAKFVGRAVEISGTLKPAKTETGAAGAPKPTGGFDPLKQDLKLFEVDVVSVRPAASQGASAAPAAPAQAASPEPAAPAAQASAPAAPRPEPAPPAQQSASAATRNDLPRTASQLPLTGLLGLLALAGGLVLRRLT